MSRSHQELFENNLSHIGQVEEIKNVECAEWFVVYALFESIYIFFGVNN